MKIDPLLGDYLGTLGLNVDNLLTVAVAAVQEGVGLQLILDAITDAEDAVIEAGRRINGYRGMPRD